jgi:hypothetical protein
MPALLTVDEVREHVETDLSDPALQRIIDAGDAEIVDRLGPLDSQIEVLPGGGEYLHLARQASAVTTGVEQLMTEGLGLQDVDLQADDFELDADGYRVRRAFDGTNPSYTWRGKVTITYVPKDTEARRKLLLAKLVQLDVNYQGLEADSVGDARTQYMKDHSAQRNSLFAQMGAGGRRFLT